ncbi:MAG: polysaccharide biosynthesis tyrosine autokinase [Parasporobacterium sp.]|nr:polysaccharide biosynthesis tyrosine autokinase [Parasporobacterium sp.]
MADNGMYDNRIDVQEQQEGEDYIQIYMSDIWRGLVKFWWLFIVLAVIIGGAVFLKSFTGYKPMYKASATFTVKTRSNLVNGTDSYSFYYDRSTANLLSGTFPYILESNLLQEAVCSEMGIETLPATISASSVPNTNMFTLTTTGKDPQVVYDVLIAVINNYPTVAEYVIGNTEMDMILIPTVPEEPYNRFEYRDKTLKGALIGLALAAVWVVIYAIFRKTIRKKADIQQQLNQKCLGVVPDVYFKKYKRDIDTRVMWTNPRIGSGFLESMRLLRNSVIHACNREKVLMVTSTAPGEGKSIVSLNLAIALSKAEKKVLLVDADVRCSAFPILLDFDKQEKDGRRAGYLYGRKVLDRTEFYAVLEIKDEGIHFLTFDIPDKKTGQLFKMHKFKQIIDAVKKDYDFVIIDTPPSGMIADASLIAEAADGALYIIRQDGIRVSRIRSSLDDLIANDTKILGCILNGASSGISGYGDNYGYGYVGSRYAAKGGYGYKYGYGYGYGYGSRKNDK